MYLHVIFSQIITTAQYCTPLGMDDLWEFELSARVALTFSRGCQTSKPNSCFGAAGLLDAVEFITGDGTAAAA